MLYFIFWIIMFMFSFMMVISIYKSYNNFISLMIVLELFMSVLIYMLILYFGFNVSVILMIIISVMIMEVSVGISIFSYFKVFKKNMFMSNNLI